MSSSALSRSTNVFSGSQHTHVHPCDKGFECSAPINISYSHNELLQRPFIYQRRTMVNTAQTGYTTKKRNEATQWVKQVRLTKQVVQASEPQPKHDQQSSSQHSYQKCKNSPFFENSSIKAASSGSTSASTVRSSSCSSRRTVPRWGNHFSFLSGLKIVNSWAYRSWSLLLVGEREVGNEGQKGHTPGTVLA
jgi:hypothetical protein